MARKEDHIAVFDSGVGGISVLKELMALMPGENYLYFGDSANAPYGDRPTAQVRQLTMAAADMLMKRGIKALVVACNTATAAAICDLRNAYPDTIIIGIEPALKLAYDRYGAGRVGVMATQVTLREDKFAHQLERFPNAQVSLIPAPGLVEQIESGKLRDDSTRALLESLLLPYKNKLDALVLGCTHYPFAASAIRNILGQQVALLDGAEGTARQTHRLLSRADLLYDGPGQLTLECSGEYAHFLSRCEALLEMNRD